MSILTQPSTQIAGGIRRKVEKRSIATFTFLSVPFIERFFKFSSVALCHYGSFNPKIPVHAAFVLLPKAV
jgi:hypothetical protein